MSAGYRGIQRGSRSLVPFVSGHPMLSQLTLPCQGGSRLVHRDVSSGEALAVWDAGAEGDGVLFVQTLL